jgi:cytochrome P450
MLNKWLTLPSGKTNTIVRDTGTLALNVISTIAFENQAANEPGQEHTLSLQDALVTVMSTNVSLVLESMLPWLKNSRCTALLPSRITKLLTATREFNAYMNDMIAKERSKPLPASATGSAAKMNLIQTLNAANTSSDGKSSRLSDKELRGNIFIFTAGGLESTSTTLSYALALLALHPEVQEWVAEEVRNVCGETGEGREYGEVFPRLKRVVAVMVSSPVFYL